MQLTLGRKSEYANASQLQGGGMFGRLCILVVGLLLTAPPMAIADPLLDEKVYAPYVEKGMFELESRLGSQVGSLEGGATTTVLEAEYGMSDRLSLSLVGILAREPTGPMKFDSIGLEGLYYVGQIPVVGVDTGLYLEYKKGIGGGESVAEGKLLFAKTAGRFQGLLNLIVERPLEVPRGEGFAEYSYAASATWRTVGALRVGAEAFGDLGSDRSFLGRRGAYLGPQLKWSVHPSSSPFEISFDAGWLAAVGTSRQEADSQVRFVVELERRF
jgi:hypothetical protein